MTQQAENTKTPKLSALKRYRRMQRQVRVLFRKTKEKTATLAAKMSSKPEAESWDGADGEETVMPSGTSQAEGHANGKANGQKDFYEKFSPILNQVKKVREAGVYLYCRPIESGQDTEVTIHGQKMVMVGSNNYLGLTSDPRVKEAAIKAIERFGSGCTGSPFLNGTLELHEELEARLAKFMKKPMALLFSTGMQANLGTLSAIVGRGDVAFSDRINHASIVDGLRLSFGKTVKFHHNDMEDLERLLKRHQNADGRLIVVDGVYSMEGDLAPLPDIVKLAKSYHAKVMVDDAHAAGVFGAHGRGTPEHFGVEDDVDILMYTFSKSFASIGGVVAGPVEVIEYLRHASREWIFSASMPPASVAGVLAALDIVEKEDWRRERLWTITKRMQQEYKRMGFNIGASQSPIISIFVWEDFKAYKMAKRLMEEGVFVNPVVSPAAPPGKALLRTSYTATHTDEQMDFVLDKFKKVGKELGVI